MRPKICKECLNEAFYILDNKFTYEFSCFNNDHFDIVKKYLEGPGLVKSSVNFWAIKDFPIPKETRKRKKQKQKLSWNFPKINMVLS